MPAIMQVPGRFSDIAPPGAWPGYLAVTVPIMLHSIAASPGARTAVPRCRCQPRGRGRMPDVTVDATVNGVPHHAQVPAPTLLVHFLRDTLRLTGTHVGCDTTQCGACTVAMDGVAVKSCTVLAAQASGHEVTTIEGLAEPFRGECVA